MTVLVSAPATRRPEREYVLDVVLGEMLGLAYDAVFIDRSDWALSLAGEPGEVVLPDVLLGGDEQAWLTPATLPAPPLATFAGIPVPYVRADEPDVFGSVFFMLSRYEERVLRAEDAYGRFPAEHAFAVRAGAALRPIVDELVDVLWERLRATWPGLTRRPAEFSVALTHDVDWITTVRQPVARVVRLVGGDALRRRDLSLAGARAAAAIRARVGSEHIRDPADTFDFLMETSERHGLASAFFFLATAPGQTAFHHEPYRLGGPREQALLRTIHERGHELGLHGSYGSQRNGEAIAAQLALLQAAAGTAGVEQEEWGGRQHFLQFEAPTTWAAWEAAGLTYDSTLAFAEAPGFRCGTTRPFRVFDLDARRALRLVERPLVAMEGSFLDAHYLGLHPDEACAHMLSLARTCKRHGGRFTLLWHNTALARAADRGQYAALVGELAAL